MKILHLNSKYCIWVFMNALDICKGEVMLMTDEGDCFNLRSKLSQIAGIMSLIEGGKMVNAKIHCSNHEDESMLSNLINLKQL